MPERRRAVQRETGRNCARKGRLPPSAPGRPGAEGGVGLYQGWRWLESSRAGRGLDSPRTQRSDERAMPPRLAHLTAAPRGRIQRRRADDVREYQRDQPGAGRLARRLRRRWLALVHVPCDSTTWPRCLGLLHRVDLRQGGHRRDADLPGPFIEKQKPAQGIPRGWKVERTRGPFHFGSEQEHLPPRSDIPPSQSSIAKGGQCPAVGGESNLHHFRLVSFEWGIEQGLHRIHRPKPDIGIRAAAGQPLAIGRKAERIEPPTMFSELCLFPVGTQVPDLDDGVNE